MFIQRNLAHFFFGTFLCLYSTTASSETPFSANDVSILLEAPERSSDPRVRADRILPAELVSAARDAFGGTARLTANGDGSDGVPPIDLSLFEDRVDQWHVASLRIDPGAPGLGEGFEVFGRHLQIRLVVQPIETSGMVRDEAIHLVYEFSSVKDETAVLCPLRSLPNESDIAAFGAALDDLIAIKAALAAEGVTTEGQPLGVHPAFDRPETAAILTGMLENFIATHLPQQRLIGLSVAGLPAGMPEPWIFAALNRDPETGGFKALPAPALEQPSGNSGTPKVRQMVSFLRGSQGEVVPPALTRNLLPVDCLMNPILAQIEGASQPTVDEGVSTTELFDGGNSAEAARRVAEVIADPTRAHFFNTDCVSCHTETRREIDAAADQNVKAREIAAAHNIAPDTMPAGMGFSNWNVRAFGWFPGFPQQQDAKETVVRRTATETAEVLECLNEGDWRDLSGPCIRTDHATLIDQGWSPEIRSGYYHRSQGSAILPLAYFLALEAPDSRERFASAANLATYGFLRSKDDEGLIRFDLPRLPVGMTKTERNGERHVGLNCAACHTADVLAGGKRLRIDGAPAAVDFDQFIADLAHAVQQTAQLQPDGQGGFEPTPRFTRFIKKVAVIEPERLAKGPEAFVEEVLAFATTFAGEMALRRPAFPSGPGRVDALTQIVNALAVKDLDIRTNHATPAAPTSYPPLWLAPKLEFVQWNLAVADPLNRNVGQALGVFGKAELLSETPFASSADLETMALNEIWADALKPPAWPEELLGMIDVAKAETGRGLFEQHCQGCHNAPPFQMTDPDENANGESFIKVKAVPFGKVGTDPLYTRAFISRWANVAPVRSLLGLPGDEVPAALFLGNVVREVTKEVVKTGVAAGQEAPPIRLRPANHEECEDVGVPCGYATPFAGAALKAGPLIGLWTTGPYLHNGSVRTVFEVISPPDERSETFWIGDRTIDADHLGFASVEADGAFLFDTKVPGNGNGGHDFWRAQPLSPQERLAIVEYLKDPMRFPMQP